MTRTARLLRERNLVHAALVRADSAAHLSTVNAAQLHQELRLTCHPATSRRWVQEWRAKAAPSPPQASGHCAGGCGDVERLAKQITNLIIRSLLGRPDGPRHCQCHGAPASRISGTGCSPDT